jgi:hypothetical protein
MHRLDVRDFGLLLHKWLGDISYYAPLLVLQVLALPVLHISGALWIAVGNVLIQSTLVVA